MHTVCFWDNKMKWDGECCGDYLMQSSVSCDAEKESMVSWISRASKLLTEIQWSGDFCDDPCCPKCLARYFKPHGKDCELAALIKEST
jgi:hypothetical protein